MVGSSFHVLVLVLHFLPVAVSDSVFCRLAQESLKGTDKISALKMIDSEFLINPAEDLNKLTDKVSYFSLAFSYILICSACHIFNDNAVWTC